MRLPRSPALSLVGVSTLMAVSGCAKPEPASNAVDVAAAASRAQSDIDNYAAVPEQDAVAPAPSPTATRVPGAAASATPVAVDATPEQVVRRYTDALAARRYAEAWALWEQQGRASGMTEAAFAASFAKYATYKATVGTPYDEDAGAGQRYISVPVTVTGTLTSGEPFRLEGPIVLHKVADGIDSDDPNQHAWYIRTSEMKSRPALPASNTR